MFIANDDDDGGNDEGVENVIDIVDTFKLKEINISKAEFTAYIKRKITHSILILFRILAQGQGSSYRNRKG